MYPTLSDSLVLSATLRSRLETLKGIDVVLAPPTAWLVPVLEGWKHSMSHVHLSAQNVWAEDQGAYTGEVSAYMLKDLVKFALVGHSERRRNQHEDDEMVREKIQACLRWRLTPILCIGETKRVVDSDGKTDAYQWQKLSTQLMEALHGVKPDDLGRIVIAHEPVWAIGNHHAASPAYFNDVASRLRDRLAEKYTKSLAANVRIIYGGSVEPSNAHEFLSQEEINGLLVGTASVKAKDFLKICEIAAKS